jgi:DNA-binding Lrp family transcriptional regulator
MSKLDGTDLKILAQLDRKTRASAAEIGRELNLTKSAIGYSMAALEEKGIILKYFALIDFFKLGYLSHRISMKFQNINRKKEEEIIKFLKNSQLSWLLSKTRGKFDVICLFWSKSHKQLSDFWIDFLSKYRSYIRETEVVPHYSVSNAGLPFTREHTQAQDMEIKQSDFVEIDKTDRLILQILSNDGRASLSDIGKQVGLSSSAIKYRIDNLIEQKVISGFRPFVDMKKLGYSSYKIDIHLNTYSNKKEIDSMIRKNPSTYSMIQTIGGSDIELKAFSKKTDHLYEMLDGINDAFSDDVAYCEFLEYPQSIKYNTMPEF